MFVGVRVAEASPAECPANLPAGVVLRVFPDEKLIAGISSGPTILTVGADVKFFPNRPPLLARGSKVLGTIVESKQAGRFHGKARMRLDLTSILTSDFCEYPIDSKIVEAGRHKVAGDMIWGRGHAKRDVVALLFPATTIYQLLRIPGRGPKLEISNETPLTIKLLQSVSLSEASVKQGERVVRSSMSSSQQRESVEPASVQCPAAPPSLTPRPVVQRASVAWPVRNRTPYHVAVYLDSTQVALMPPCSGPSLITTPVNGFKLQAAGSIPITGGQKQIGLKVVPAVGGGWEIVEDDAGRDVAAN
jgi:hypothetical protein